MFESNSLNAQKGKEAEKKFQQWLDKNNIPYMYIHQEPETFASFFKAGFKRPDFIILIPNIGLILVDVKYRVISNKHNDIAIDSDDLTKYSKLQRNFNLPIWFAISNREINYEKWFWIPVSKTIELMLPQFKSSLSQMDYNPIKLEEFIEVSDKDSLHKIFQRLF